MSTKRVDVEVGFKTNQNSYNQLKAQLKEISNLTTSQFKAMNPDLNLDTREAMLRLREIKQQAEVVENALTDAFNPVINTVNVDKFNASMKKVNLAQLNNNFKQVGLAGENAFRGITSQMLATNKQIKESTTLLDSMATSFKNTVKWGISSSAWNTMTNSLQKSWNYAQKLDKSLNNIRIVSNASASDMEKFAIQANRAAQALGTTTRDYTDASLIYYQQGLNTQEVIDRTNTTIQMANVLGSTSKEVSNYMTAIWNNFAQGSSDLTYFGDVITALGAKTASSAEEIAGGLEKFASIGQTVGLSYEYATSALATIVAATRQSEDTVGTALKTLFARIQGLNLGETLEDGTTLNKYSSALEKVGINIKAQNGELKNMDTILDEMGTKWKTLSQDQKVALAETVAGVRQYNQLMSLMDNWDNFQSNLNIAYGASGTLQKQQEIYLESAEAKMESLRASGERLMTAIFNPNNAKGLIDSLKDVTDGFSNIIEGIGGGNNAFLMLGSTALRVFDTQIARGLTNTVAKLGQSKSAADSLNKSMSNFSADNNGISQFGDEATKEINRLRIQLNSFREYMSEATQKSLEENINSLSTQYENAKKRYQDYWDLITKTAKLAPKEFEGSLGKDPVSGIPQLDYTEDPMILAKKSQQDIRDALNATVSAAEGEVKGVQDLIQKIDTKIAELNSAHRLQAKKSIQEIETELRDLFGQTSAWMQAAGKYHAGVFDDNQLKNLRKYIKTFEDLHLKDTTLYHKTAGGPDEVLKAIQNDVTNTINLFAKAKEKLDTTRRDINKTFNEIDNDKENFINTQEGLDREFKKEVNTFQSTFDNYKQIVKTKSLVDMAGAIGQLASSMSTLFNIPSILNNENLSSMEKFFQIMSSLFITLPMLSSAISVLKANWKDAAVAAGTFIIKLGEWILQSKIFNRVKDEEIKKNIELAASEKAVAKANLESAAAKKANAKAGQAKSLENKLGANSGIGKGTLKTSEGAMSTMGGGTTLVKGLPGGATAATATGVQGATGATATGATGATAGAAAGLGSALAAIAIVVAVVAAIAAVTYWVVKFNDAQKEALENAQKYYDAVNEEAQRAEEKFRNATQEAESLKSTIESYNDAVKTMNDLNTSVEDQAQALETANGKARELIEKYKLFDDYTVKDGLIVFNEGTLDKVQAQQDLEAAQAKSAYQASKINQLDASRNVELQRLSNSMGTKRLDKRLANFVKNYGNAKLNLGNIGMDIVTSNIWTTWKALTATQQDTESRNEVNKAELDALSRQLASFAEKTPDGWVKITEAFDGGRDKFEAFIKTMEGFENASKQEIDALYKSRDALKEFTKATIDSIKETNYYIQQLYEAIEEEEHGSESKAIGDSLYYATGGRVDASKTTANLNSVRAYLKTNNKNNSVNSENTIPEYTGTSVSGLQAWMNKNNYHGGNWDLTKGDNEVALFKAYVEAKYGKEARNQFVYTDDFDFSGDNFSGSATGTGKYSGVEIDFKNKETIVREIAAMAHAEMIKEQVKANSIAQDKTVNDVMNKLLHGTDGKSGAFGLSDKYNADFVNPILKNILKGGTGEIDFSETFKGISPEEFTELGQWGTEEWRKAFGLTDAELEALGIKSSTEFFEKLKTSFAEYDFDEIFPEQIKLEVSLIDKEKEKLSDEEVKEIEEYAKHLADIADSELDVGDKVQDNLNQTADDAVKAAKNILKMNRGIENLANGIEDWSDVIKNSKASSQEFFKATLGIKQSLSDILGIDMDEFDASFIKKNLNDIKAAAEGDEEAINRLREATLEKIEIELGLNDELINQRYQEMSDKLKELIGQEDYDISVGINDADFIEAANRMIDAAGLTKDQVNKLFAGMGYDVTFVTKPEEVSNTVPEYTTYHQLKDYDGPGDTDYSEVTWTEQTGTKKMSGEAIAFAMETGAPGEITTPHIEKITERPSASTNNYSKTNPGGGGSKGKKGSGSRSKPQKMKKVDDEKDRYHKVNTQLAIVDKNLKKLESQEEKTFGTKLVDNLNKQLKLYNRQIDLTNEKMKIAYGEADELRNKLSQSGVKFNADGTVSNYMESLQAQENYINSLINKYNKMSAKQQESYKETIEQEKEKYEEFKKNIDRYDELVSDFIPGLQQDVQDAIDKQIEINVQKFNLEIDVALDLREAQQQWLEFKKDILDDIVDKNILGNMKYARETLNTVLNNTEVGGSLQTNTRHIQDIMREINIMRNGGKSSVYGDNEEKALEDLRNYINESQTDLTTVKEMADAIKDSWLQGAEQAKEVFDDQITQLQIIDSILEHQLNMLELAYGDNAYAEQEKLYQEKINSIDAQIGFQRNEAAFWAAQLEDAKAELAKTDKDSADYYRYQELVNNFRDNLEEAMNELEASYEAKMDAITNAYIAHVEKVFKALEKGLTNNVGFDWANEQWDLMNKNSEEYLDNINAMYKVQELSNKYNDAINQSNNIKIQQKLASLRDSEMDALREKDKLSEYDLKRADLRYQIALKQIALEEAQQNKSTMRLKRDSQGNYSYVYAADEDKIASIREEVSNLYNELYNLDLDKYKENLEKVNEYTAEWIEKYKEISEDKTLTDEEREARWYDLEVYYGDLINSLAEDNAYIRDNLYQSSMAELFDLYDQNADNYEAMTDEQKAMVEQFMDDTKDYTRAAYDTVFEIYNENLEKFYDMTAEQKEMLMNELVPAWESTYQTLIDTVTGEGGFIQAMKTATDDIKASAEIYFKTLKDNYDIANKDADTYKTLVHGITTENETVINQYEQLIADIRKDQKDWEAWEGIWSKALEDSKQTLKNAQDLTEEILKQNELGYRNQENPETHADGSAQSETQPSTNTGNNTPTTSQPAAPSLAKGAYVQVKSGTKWYTNSYGGGTSGYAHAGTIKYINERGSHAYNIDGLGWVRKTDIVGYATGGYTGDWTGQDGRLAMLHQKEMVLNAEDTRNMLDAVKIIRDITNSMNMTLLSRLVNISANGGINTTSEPLEQNVHIEANFPNVTSQNEIENAINNLVNMASQRVSTK